MNEFDEDDINLDEISEDEAKKWAEIAKKWAETAPATVVGSNDDDIWGHNINSIFISD